MLIRISCLLNCTKPEMGDGFRFKQFTVEQSGCAMKINTDGVLIGAIATAAHSLQILDIGTGTGVIALMLAQRFPLSLISAVEIDAMAAETAASNFKHSPFHERLRMFPVAMQLFFNQNYDQKFDLIVSNPPFFLRSLESAGAKKALAKHTDIGFFSDMLSGIRNCLLPKGSFWLILPPETARLLTGLAVMEGLFLQLQINVLSFPGDRPHREICCYGWQPVKSPSMAELIIYQQPKTYSTAYTALLKDFFTIF